ncbi:MAG: hypothetical protein ABH828_00390 [archaeon]
MNKTFDELMHDREWLGGGDDSSVYLTKDNLILKKYDLLHAKLNFSKKKVLALLNKYKQDTENAIEILKDDKDYLSNKTLSLNGVEYRLDFSIIPQGELYTNKNDLKVDKFYSLGQEFIPDLNAGFGLTAEISKIITEKYSLTTGPAEEGSIADVATDSRIHLTVPQLGSVQDLVNPLTDILNKELKRDFYISPANFKPSLNSKEKIAYIKITDLADSIRETYNFLIN